MVTIAVKVVPGSSRSRVTGRYGEGVKVQVAAPPEDGKANEAVVALLADFFGVSGAAITLISGRSKPRKLFRIEGIDSAGLGQKLDTLE